MFYTSTRDNSVKVTASKAITDGISKDGGLYIPTEIPAVSLDELKSLCSIDYKKRAKRILGLYLTDFTKEELDSVNWLPADITLIDKIRKEMN